MNDGVNESKYLRVRICELQDDEIISNQTMRFVNGSSTLFVSSEQSFQHMDNAQDTVLAYVEKLLMSKNELMDEIEVYVERVDLKLCKSCRLHLEFMKGYPEHAKQEIRNILDELINLAPTA